MRRMNFDGIIGLSVGALALAAAAACDLDVILPSEVEEIDIQGTESLALLASKCPRRFRVRVLPVRLPVRICWRRDLPLGQ